MTPELAAAAELAAIIVNYNAGPEIRAALQSIASEMSRFDSAEQRAGRGWEAIVVDNVSTDGSSDYVWEFAPHARVLPNTVNVGFGRGINQGVAESSAPFILIMNPDIVLDAGAVPALVQAAERYQDAGMLAPELK